MLAAHPYAMLSYALQNFYAEALKARLQESRKKLVEREVIKTCLCLDFQTSEQKDWRVHSTQTPNLNRRRKSQDKTSTEKEASAVQTSASTARVAGWRCCAGQLRA